jgi:hypothetical protein
VPGTLRQGLRDPWGRARFAARDEQIEASRARGFAHLPPNATVLDQLHAARRAAGIADLDEGEATEVSVMLAREAREELAAFDQ